MNTQERYLKTTELLKKFKNGEELYRNNPMFHQSIQMLISGMSEYEVMEQLIISADRIQKAFEDYMMRDTRPVTINK